MKGKSGTVCNRPVPQAYCTAGIRVLPLLLHTPPLPLRVLPLPGHEGHPHPLPHHPRPPSPFARSVTVRGRRRRSTVVWRIAVPVGPGSRRSGSSLRSHFACQSANEPLTDHRGSPTAQVTKSFIASADLFPVLDLWRRFWGRSELSSAAVPGKVIITAVVLPCWGADDFESV